MSTMRSVFQERIAMRRIRTMVVVLIVARSCLVTSAWAQAEANKAGPDGPTILAKSREAYQKLSGYRFEYVQEISESNDGKTGEPSRRSFVLATDGAKFDPQNKLAP